MHCRIVHHTIGSCSTAILVSVCMTLTMLVLVAAYYYCCGSGNSIVNGFLLEVHKGLQGCMYTAAMPDEQSMHVFCMYA